MNELELRMRQSRPTESPADRHLRLARGLWDQIDMLWTAGSNGREAEGMIVAEIADVFAQVALFGGHDREALLAEIKPEIALRAAGAMMVAEVRNVSAAAVEMGEQVKALAATQRRTAIITAVVTPLLAIAVAAAAWVYLVGR